MMDNVVCAQADGKAAMHTGGAIGGMGTTPMRIAELI